MFKEVFCFHDMDCQTVNEPVKSTGHYVLIHIQHIKIFTLYNNRFTIEVMDKNNIRWKTFGFIIMDNIKVVY